MTQSDEEMTVPSRVLSWKMQRRTLIQRAMALSLAGGTGIVLAPGGRWGEQHAAAQSSDTFTYAVSTDPETLDPQVTSNTAASTVFVEIYASLAYQELDLSWQPLLAKGWTVSPDNLTITFTLRDGLTFQDGTKFDSSSVKYTFERLQQIGTKSPIYEAAKSITSITAPDPLTVAFTFQEPSATFFHDIGSAYAGILSQPAVEKAGDGYGRAPIGMNAYELKQWQTGSMVTLATFPAFAAAPGYYKNQGVPKIAQIAFKVIPDAFSQTASLQSGEIDSAGISATDLPRFANDSNFQIFSSQVTGIEYLGLTSSRPLMSDVQVRQAIAYAIDRDEIVNTLYSGGLAQAVYTALPPSIQGYNQQLADSAPHFNLDQANALLTKAGWQPGSDKILVKDGQAMKPVLYTTTDTTVGQLATLIQAQLKKVGIDVQIKQLELASLLDFTPKGEHDMLVLGYNWDEPDALYLFLSSTRLKSSNRAHYSNPAFDQLVEQGRHTLDPDQRMQIYYQAQQLLIQDMPWVPLFMPIDKTAVSSRVKGVSIFPTGGLLLNDATIGS